MGNRQRKATTTSAHQHLRDPVERWIERAKFYGGPSPDEVIRAALSIFRAGKSGGDLKRALEGSSRGVIGRIDTLQPMLEQFRRSPQSHAFIGLLKESRPLQKSPIVPLILRRYDLPTLWADLPQLLKAFSGLLTHQSDFFLTMLPPADKKRVRNRALVWLYLTVRPFETSDTKAHAVLAKIICPEDVSGEKKISDHIRWFQRDHPEEYRQIEQYLEHRRYPTENELRFFAFFGTTDTTPPVGEER